ncbi:acetyltransferase [Acidovorax delafieldii 2AN]|uniref:Acetyltransferase n=1 Tax=Acidovorax delafieldii 2AN TaxID=573060 RepID=C5TD13_ACIDE|nr:acyltransferase [Acidovorax delafieldii]EER57635.1 acetyltransferase [Acidovorax delafieldii 2AN]
MRALLNRWRRRLWRQLFYRMVFGEQGRAGLPLPHTRIAPSTCIEGEAGLDLADHVFIGQFNFLNATAGLRIAEGVQITNFVSIVTHSSHRSIRLLGRAYASHQGEVPGYVRAPVEIGAYSFIGPHSVVEAGSRIGKGVVVCAHSRVRGEVPDFAIVAGSPAAIIGDVRTGDAHLLARHPELADHYTAWAGDLPHAEPGHG